MVSCVLTMHNWPSIIASRNPRPSVLFYPALEALPHCETENCDKKIYRYVLTMSVALVAQGTRRDEEEDDEEILRHEAARQRWRLLADALKKRNSEKLPHESVAESCMGISFGLVTCTPNETGWFQYECQGCRIMICHVAEAVSPRALAGFNNTGNVRVWSSEEVLAHYCLKQGPALFEGRAVLELGGGMTCLAGLMVAKSSSPSKVHLSDGNSAAVANVKRIVMHNDFTTEVSCSILRWHEASKWANTYGYFDLILCADCLFFDEARPALASAIACLLRKGGSALVMAPRRGGTFDIFMEEAASRGLLCSVAQCYDENVWASHEALLDSHNQGGAFYEEDLHYPLLLVLTKPV